MGPAIALAALSGRGPLQAGQGHLGFGRRNRHCTGDAAPQRIRHPRRFAGIPLEWYSSRRKGRGTFHDASVVPFAGAVLGTAIDGSTGTQPLGSQAPIGAATLFSGGTVWSALGRYPSLTPTSGRPLPPSWRCGWGLSGDGAPGGALDVAPLQRAPDRSSPLEPSEPGRFFVFWVHVECLVYGFASRTLRRQLTPGAGSCGVACHGRGECTPSYCWAGTAWALGAASLTVLQNQ